MTNTCSRIRLKAFALSAAAVAALWAPAASAQMPTPDHVVVVLLENKDLSEYNSTNAPFIYNSLINGGLFFSNSTGMEHPSQPNYLQLFSGSDQGVNNANATSSNMFNFSGNPAYAGHTINYPGYGTLPLSALGNAGGDGLPNSTNFNNVANGPFTTANLGSELAAAGKSFKEYAEGLTSVPTLASGGTLPFLSAQTFNHVSAIDNNGNVIPSVLNDANDATSLANLAGQSNYVRRHDPAINWISSNPTGNQLPTSAETDFSNFGTDFAHLPNVSFVIPNTQNDMHDTFSGLNASITTGDTWLANNLGGYLAWAKTHNSLLIVTSDENDNSPLTGSILTVMNGDPSLFQAGTSTQSFNHLDMLRSLEDLYGTGYAGDSATATGLNYANGQFTASVVPEPASVGLLSAASVLAMSVRRRRAMAC
jgi:acid phosphatase